MVPRVALGLVGTVASAYGVLLLLDLGWDNLIATATWLIGGVVLHDAVLAPVTIAVCAVGASLVRSRAALAAGLLILGTITLTAVPVLSGKGVRADNPTLLDRPYWAGWLIVVVLVACAVAVASALSTRRRDQDRQA